ncbi:uncharacterized protein N7515_004788 [Penicillium bovifimosum]|uniref:Uncharacterized protein n=1 Tax=Penicillium bovifimosum TaxID=126998 RepID=A0A9W9L2S0_9EURO|nr:uncharacterized protein N7515_004788 [Penicillium bovifimosum]KAJ5135510.1 hypothetical protein N7515_004788 [Penicillium bovifimosum]
MRNHFISSTTPMLRNMSVSRPAWRLVQPLQSATHPLGLRAQRGVRNYSVFTKDWKGSNTEDHIRSRSDKGDNEDVHAEASSSATKEREENAGVGDDSKSGAVTERGGSKSSKKAKQDHPKAPEPVVGMNEERGRKGDQD